MPSGREQVVARHACLKYSGRVGRSRGAKELDEQAIRLAVRAHVRHAETDYDRLLATIERHEARAMVEPDVLAVLDAWQRAPGT
jgi:hypothetical protein